MEQNILLAQLKKNPNLFVFFQERESTLPAAISDTLSTDKGTLFYVLTVAGEDGIPPSSDERSTPDSSNAVGSTFITEAATPPASQPEYILSINIADQELVNIKKR